VARPRPTPLAASAQPGGQAPFQSARVPADDHSARSSCLTCHVAAVATRFVHTPAPVSDPPRPSAMILFSTPDAPRTDCNHPGPSCCGPKLFILEACGLRQSVVSMHLSGTAKPAKRAFSCRGSEVSRPQLVARWSLDSSRIAFASSCHLISRSGACRRPFELLFCNEVEYLWALYAAFHFESSQHCVLGACHGRALNPAANGICVACRFNPLEIRSLPARHTGTPTGLAI